MLAVSGVASLDFPIDPPLFPPGAIRCNNSKTVVENFQTEVHTFPMLPPNSDTEAKGGEGRLQDCSQICPWARTAPSSQAVTQRYKDPRVTPKTSIRSQNRFLPSESAPLSISRAVRDQFRRSKRRRQKRFDKAGTSEYELQTSAKG